MSKALEPFASFANTYIARFMETLVLGTEGGLYNEKIVVEEGKEGIFDHKTIGKFVRFQHGDNDYHYEFGRLDDKLLQSNYKETAKAFLALIDTNWGGKDHYTTIAPHLIKNAKESLQTVINGKRTRRES